MFVIFLILLMSFIASDIRFRGISGPLPALSLLTQEIAKASRHVRGDTDAGKLRVLPR